MAPRRAPDPQEEPSSLKNNGIPRPQHANRAASSGLAFRPISPPCRGAKLGWQALSSVAQVGRRSPIADGGAAEQAATAGCQASEELRHCAAPGASAAAARSPAGKQSAAGLTAAPLPLQPWLRCTCTPTR